MTDSIESIYERNCREVAINHGVGTTLCIGHRPSYFKEAALNTVKEIEQFYLQKEKISRAFSRMIINKTKTK